MKRIAATLAFVTAVYASGAASAATLGTTDIDATDNGTLVSIGLNATGLNYLASAIGGAFAFGGTYSGNGYTFGFSYGTQAVLTIVSTTGVNALLSTNTGWYRDTDYNESFNKNYISGQYSGHEYRNFFVFGGATGIGSIIAATLQIFNPATGVDGSGVFALHDFNASLTDLEGGGTRPGMFTALGGVSVPGPIAGAGLPVALGLMGFAAWRRRQSQSA